MKILIEESVLRQALEFFNDEYPTSPLTAKLRSALDAAEKVDAQLNQARADALREAAAIFDQKHTQLKHCHNYHQCTARDLRAMAAEIEGEKK